MRMSNTIKSVRPVEGYRLKLVFDDGYVSELDLLPLVNAPCGPLEAPLQDEKFFQQVACDGFTIGWPNSYDICPDVLRFWCERGRVCSRQETDAAFVEILAHKEEPASALHDKPKQ